jgi:hypothetical protein
MEGLVQVRSFIDNGRARRTCTGTRSIVTGTICILAVPRVASSSSPGQLVDAVPAPASDS